MTDLEKKNNLEKYSKLELKIQEVGTHVSVALELVVAVLVLLACICGLIALFPHLADMFAGLNGMAGQKNMLSDFLERVFTVVVGIEFLKMLCKPSSANVLETIIFLVARHMILVESKPWEDFLYVMAIVCLVLTKHFLVRDNRQFVFRGKKQDEGQTDTEVS